jgi:hypothetical protein
MEIYHYIFGILKFSIIFIYSLHIFNIIDYKPHIEVVLEDVFTLFIGVLAIYIFYPFRKKTIVSFEDKIFGSAAGFLLLASIDYKKISNDFFNYSFS